MLKNLERKAIPFALISIFFLFSMFINLELIPISWLLLGFGLPGSEMGFLMLLFYLYVLMFIVHIVLGIYASKFPKREKWATNKFLNYFRLEFFGILVIVITFFSIIVISILKVYLLPLSISQFVNLYLFWFFALKTLEKVIPVKVQWQGYK
ncbi:MAG: hypothetical protein KAU07_02590 [Candidatus Andersenbacteria bacterium]|nr:hypothetical protein [Candidatus Andersenbacteria bacterium]